MEKAGLSAELDRPSCAQTDEEETTKKEEIVANVEELKLDVAPSPETIQVATPDRSLADIPAELLVNILAQLPATELINVAPLVCRSWKATAELQSIWQKLCQDRGWKGSETGSKIADWRRYYFQHLGVVSNPNCTHFLPPGDEKPLVDRNLPLSLSTFFYHWMPDERKEWWNEYHTELGYWGPPEIDDWVLSPEGCCIHRALRFVVPISNRLGPKQTRNVQTQRLRFIKRGHLMFATSTVSLDVPYGDTFSTESLWNVYANPSSETSPSLKLVISGRVHFTKSFFLKMAVQMAAQGAIDAYFPGWAAKAETEAEAINAAKKKRQLAEHRAKAKTLLLTDASTKKEDPRSRGQTQLPQLVSEASDTIEKEPSKAIEGPATAAVGQETKSSEEEDEQAMKDAEQAEGQKDEEESKILDRKKPHQQQRQPPAAALQEQRNYLDMLLSVAMDFYAGKNRKEVLVAFLLLLVVLSPFMFTWYHMMNMQSAIAQYHARADQAEAKLASLCYVVGQLTKNITGVGGNSTDPIANLSDQWDYWRSVGMFDALLKDIAGPAEALAKTLEKTLMEARFLIEFVLGVPSLPPEVLELLELENNNNNNNNKKQEL